MNKEEIIEGNELIVSFLGWTKFSYNQKYDLTHCRDYDCYNIGEFSKYSDIYIPESGNLPAAHYNLEFHSSWSWLMPVVDKIEMTSWDISLTKRYLHNPDLFHGNPFRTGDIFVGYDEREEFKGWFWQAGFSDLPSITIKESNEKALSRIEATWLAVVEFIKFWNKSNK